MSTITATIVLLKLGTFTNKYMLAEAARKKQAKTNNPSPQRKVRSANRVANLEYSG